MKVGLFTGSFEVFHSGHLDIFLQATSLFHTIIVARGIHPGKGITKPRTWTKKEMKLIKAYFPNTKFITYNCLLSDLVNEYKVDAVIRGLRNGNDFLYEQQQAYTYQDEGMVVPTVFFLCDRGLTHISSTNIKTINKIKKNKC